MLNSFEPKKIKDAKEGLSINLRIAKRKRETDIENQKSIFDFLKEIKDKVLDLIR